MVLLRRWVVGRYLRFKSAVCRSSIKTMVIWHIETLLLRLLKLLRLLLLFVVLLVLQSEKRYNLSGSDYVGVGIKGADF